MALYIIYDIFIYSAIKCIILEAVSKPMDYKPSHLLIDHYIFNLARHLANGDLNYVFPISAMLICESLTHKIQSHEECKLVGLLMTIMCYVCR